MVRHAPEPLGGHVAQGADQVAGAGQVLLARGAGQAEVGDPDRAVGVEQQVGRLDVAMNDPLAGGVRQRLGRLHAQPGDAEGVAVIGMR